MNEFILDVGCGNSPVGDVNCDLYLYGSTHRGMNCGDDVLEKRYISNLVCCDAQFLPFKDGCFDVVVSRQLIEHVSNPVKMFGELVRVARRLIRVETVLAFTESLVCSVNRKAKRWVDVHHINKFNQRKLISYGNRFGVVFSRGYNINYWMFPHEYFCLLRFPSEIGVEFVKV